MALREWSVYLRLDSLWKSGPQKQVRTARRPARHAVRMRRLARGQGVQVSRGRWETGVLFWCDELHVEHLDVEKVTGGFERIVYQAIEEAQKEKELDKVNIRKFRKKKTHYCRTGLQGKLFL